VSRFVPAPGSEALANEARDRPWARRRTSRGICPRSARGGGSS